MIDWLLDWLIGCLIARVQILKRLKERSKGLVALRVRGLKIASWGPHCLRWGVAHQLLEIVMNQKGLESFDVRGAHMAPDSVKLLLCCLYLGSDHALKKLNIVNVISEKSKLVRRAGFARYLPLLTGLQEIHMNFKWVTPLLLDRLSLKCLDLQLVVLEVFSPDFTSEITTDNWTQVTERLPNLKVHLTLRDAASAAADFVDLLVSLLYYLPANVDNIKIKNKD